MFNGSVQLYQEEWPGKHIGKNKMSSLMNVDVSLKEVIEEIRKGNFLIPNFQRGFVWKGPDIESLGDSIVRGYPISSILTMPANGNLKVTYTALKTSGATIGSNQNAHYVLDGQQRITSLAKLFLGYDEEKDYYFDLLSILDDAFPEDSICRIPVIQGRLQKGRYDRHNGYSAISTDLCRAFRKTSDSVNAKQDYRFIRGDVIINERFGSAVSRFLRVFEGLLDEKVIDKYTDYLNAVLGAMGGYGIPFTKIRADADLGLVIRVFEKVNTSGKKLTLFDLVNAKSFDSEEYRDGLAGFMRDSLDRAEKNPSYSASAIRFFFEKKSTGNGDEYMDLAPFIRCVSIADYLKRDAVPSIANKEMLGKESSHWFAAWAQYSDTLLRFISRLDQEGILQLINGTFIEYMAAIVMNEPKLLNEPIFIREVKRYGLHMILSDQTFSKTNMNVVMEFYSLGKHLVKSHEFGKLGKDITIRPDYSTSLSAERVEKMGQNLHSFKALMYILYNERFGGKFAVDICGNPIKSQNIGDMDQHHLYPKARTKHECATIYNSIANVVLVNRTCNQHVIKDKKTFDYFRELAAIHGEHSEYIFSQNLLPEEMYSNEDIDPIVVLRKRLNMIVDLVNGYFWDGHSRCATDGSQAMIRGDCDMGAAETYASQ